jgi:iron(III) transport system substrate-binding protein
MNSPRRFRAQAAVTLTAVTVLILAGCSSTTSSAGGPSDAEGSTTEAPLDPSALVIYNAQHENLTTAWADAFTKESGIKVQLRNGDDLSMANQLVAEGSASPADVFITENSPGMTLVEQAGLFADVDTATLAQVPAQYSPSTGKWVGVAARSTVFVYNTSKLKPADLPKSIMDLADPKWKGRWGASPSGADFQAIVSAMLELKGADATRAWLAAMKTNAAPYKGNSTVMKAVNAGEIDGGVIYHYYWYGDQAKTKENSKNTQLEFFGHQDPGAFVSVSGAGVLASSKKQQEAQKFLAFITSRPGQDIVATNVQEYPLNAASAAANTTLKPLDTLDPPKIDPAKLNSKEVVDLMTETGLL